MQIFRIADARHAVWDGTGAAMLGGRWNKSGQPVIYGAASFACAMLEVLVHANIGRVPATQVCVVAELADDVTMERHTAADLPTGWDAEDLSVPQQFGDLWLREQRSLVLLVPSVVARLEFIAVFNPQHPQAGQVRLLPSQPVIWDQRLFAPHTVHGPVL